MIERLDPLDPNRAVPERIYFGEAQFVPLDDKGRVTLPELMRSECKILDQAVFVGMRDRFHIWSPSLELEWAKRAREIGLGLKSLKTFAE